MKLLRSNRQLAKATSPGGEASKAKARFGAAAAKGDSLTDRQLAFAAAYLSNGYNATRAAMAAGHKCNSAIAFAVQGSNHLRNAKVRAAIGEHFRRAHMSADEVVARLVEQATANPVQFFDKRWRLKRHALDIKGHLVKRLTVPTRGKPAEIELHDGQAALVKVGIHLGLFSEKMQHLGDVGGPICHEFTLGVAAD